MITGKEYKKVNNDFRKNQKGTCDRCGNDFAVGQATIMHFPAIKTYIELCALCNYGLLLGFHNDFVLLQNSLDKYGK